MSFEKNINQWLPSPWRVAIERRRDGDFEDDAEDVLNGSGQPQPSSEVWCGRLIDDVNEAAILHSVISNCR